MIPAGKAAVVRRREPGDLVGWANALASPRRMNDVKARLPMRLAGGQKNAWSDERESCINVSGLLVEQILLRTIMGIRAHPGSLAQLESENSD